jgi:hypothetical protein
MTEKIILFVKRTRLYNKHRVHNFLFCEKKHKFTLIQNTKQRVDREKNFFPVKAEIQNIIIFRA